MTRCMDSDTMKQEFPEAEQRAAVCSSQWERKDHAQARSAWICNALTYPVITGMIVLGGCASMQTTGTVQSEDKAHSNNIEFASAPGWLCRELRGEADLKIGGIKGQGQGGRCQRLGTEAINGCFSFNSDRVNFESPGCRPAPRPAPSDADLDQLRDQLDALENEFEQYLKGDK